MKFNVLRFDSIDSTNTEALKHARRGANEGLCVVARQQTAGRGRQGRTWVSPMDAGLYLSVVLRPKIEAIHLPLITLASAVAVFDSLTSLGLEPDIKWPNDVLVREKKICGILAETSETERGVAVIVGIGINLRSNSYPPELVEIATSLEKELERPVGASELETLLFPSFDNVYSDLSRPDGPSETVKAWSIRSTFSKRKPVRVTLTNETITGTTDGLESDGALRVVSGDGILRVFHTGNVERLRIQE